MADYFVVNYSRKKREPEIQAELYAAINQTGLEARIGMTGYLPSDRGRKKCIFDIVVFWPLNHKPICIVECKDNNPPKKDSAQMMRYRKFGLPVIGSGRCNQKDVVRSVVAIAQESAHRAPPSFTWSGHEL